MIEYSISVKRPKRFVLFDRWVWRMAWRDARKNISRLFLFTASLVAGITAIVAISSLNDSLHSDLDRNARELLGADAVLHSSKKPGGEIVRVLDSLKLQIAHDADMPSMVMFLHTRQSRLIKLVAMDGPFPFYGKMETKPANAPELMKTGRYAMLDESLATQYEVSSDDSIKVGNTTFKVAGVVAKIPGGGGFTTTITPAVYISMQALDSTGLVQFGSRVNYGTFLKTNSEKETELVLNRLRPLTKKQGYNLETVERRKEGLGRSFQAVYSFFSLLAFVSLILGCIGVASSVHIYAREKRDEVAILRCVGSSGWQAFGIYFIQIFLLGIAGSLVGVVLGAGLHQLIPVMFASYIPLEVQVHLSWKAMLIGLTLGTTITLLFTVLPLISVRFVPPLAVLRSEGSFKTRISKTKIFVLAIIVIFPVLAAAAQTRSWITGISFALGLGVALGCLYLVAKALLYVVRKFFPKRSGFIFRHALSNLFRPNNQTATLLVSIGLGAYIIATLNIIESSLLNQVEFKGNENDSNTIMFDIQPSQKDGVVKLMQDNKLKVNQLVPMITCRISALKNKTIEELQKDTAHRIPNWVLTREFRVTYRDSLTGSEELTKGVMQHYKPHKHDSVGVTISEGMQESLDLGIGDSLVFDMQGIPVKAFITGFRKVDWPKDPPNFVFVFPTGVLENAPKIYVAATRVTDPVQANRFQQELVTAYPNVSLIDLRLIIKTIKELFDKVGLVVRFLALFSIAAGLVVLAGAVMNSKFIRIKENVLLRTLGARSRQLTLITLIEYFWLGLFSALTGIVLSFAGGWVLTKYFFEIQFDFNLPELALIGAGVVTLTVLIGWWNSRSVITTPPLQVLRKES